jgi:hypothetical protein
VLLVQGLVCILLCAFGIGFGVPLGQDQCIVMKCLQVIDLAKDAHFMGNHVSGYVPSLPMPNSISACKRFRI